jgi:hypothetical protein
VDSVFLARLLVIQNFIIDADALGSCDVVVLDVLRL